MFLLLVTNRNSNILEDLETLRLLSKLVPEYAGTLLDEEAISRAAFDLIFAFDEVIALGHKENITVQQVRQQRVVCLPRMQSQNTRQQPPTSQLLLTRVHTTDMPLTTVAAHRQAVAVQQ
jgi:hypothetical protein